MLVMAFYLVRARPRSDRMDELRWRLESGELEEMGSVGNSLLKGLRDARYNPETREAAWEEEDYCRPPLAREREAVLDDYFDVIETKRVYEGEGWREIESLPSLWTEVT
jgi:hypothetical protein